MKQLFSFLLIISMCLVRESQAQEIFVSPDINTRGDFGYEILTGWPKGEVLLFRDKVLKYSVETYDSTLQLVDSKELDFQHGFTSIIAVEKLDTSFVVVYSYRFKGRIYITADYFDKNLEPVRQATIYSTTKGVDLNSFQWVVSENKRQGAIFFSRGTMPLHIIPVSLDSPIMTPAILLTFSEKKWKNSFVGASINNKGEMFFVLNQSRRWFSDREKELSVYMVSPKGEIEHISYIPEGLKLLNIALKVDELNDRLILAGSFSKQGKQAGGYWLFPLRFGQSSRDSLYFLPFSKQLIRKLTGNRESKGKGNLQVTDIVLRKDGGVVLFGEVRKKYRRRPELAKNLDITGPGVSGWMDYYYEDIVAMSIHPNGQKHWEEVLYKHQYSQDDNAIYSSYTIMSNPALLRLLYNDEISGSNTVSEYLVSSEGVIDRRTVINTTRQKLWLRWRDAYQTKYNEIIVPSQGYHRLNIVKIKFNY